MIPFVKNKVFLRKIRSGSTSLRKMDEIKQELELLKREVSGLRLVILDLQRSIVLQSAGVRRLEHSAEKMDRHINFVEGIWQRIRRPFFGIIEYASRWQISDE